METKNLHLKISEKQLSLKLGLYSKNVKLQKMSLDVVYTTTIVVQNQMTA